MIMMKLEQLQKVARDSRSKIYCWNPTVGSNFEGVWVWDKGARAKDYKERGVFCTKAVIDSNGEVKYIL